MLEDGRTLRDATMDHLITLADGDPGVWGEAVTGLRRLERRWQRRYGQAAPTAAPRWPGSTTPSGR